MRRKPGIDSKRQNDIGRIYISILSHIGIVILLRFLKIKTKTKIPEYLLTIPIVYCR